MKILVYGKGEYYRNHKKMLPNEASILAFVDSNMENTTIAGKGQFEGKDVIHVSEILSIQFDFIYVCTDVGYAWEILHKLKDIGVSTEKIKLLYRECLKKKWDYVATDDGKGYINSIGNIRFEERTYTDFLSYEILIDDEYGMPIRADRYVVADIGMNVGITSLYYAQKTECEKVYGFEPFKDTFKRALNNFELSPVLAKKIVPLNYALSDEVASKRIRLQNEESGQRSIIPTDGAQGNCYEVECKCASIEIEKIRKMVNVPIVLNIDTEGSEFAIMRDLDRNNGFDNVIAIAIEWHSQPNELFSILEKNCFKYYIKDRGDEGVVYALREE